MSKSVLIVGHGYIGSELARQLNTTGHPVVALNRTSDGEHDLGYPLLDCDVSDGDSVTSLRERLPFDPECIVHCASSGRGGADAYRAVFLEGTSHLQKTFSDTPILFTSSTSVYGQTDGSVVTETSPTEPDRETSRLLVEAEGLICSHGGIALRLAGIYGPSRSIYLKRILEGTAKIEAGEVSRLVNQIHRDDAVGAIRFLIGQPPGTFAGEIFNVSDDEPITQRDCYERLANFFEVAVPPEEPPNKNRKRAWTHKAVSNEKLKAKGWELEYPTFIDALSTDARLVSSMREEVGK